MKKLLIASMIAGSFGLSGQANAASTPIWFDLNGSAAGGLVQITSFDWGAGNALSVGALSSVNGLFNTYYQSSLSVASFNPDGNRTDYIPLGNSEFTVQAKISEQAFGVGTANANFVVTGGSFDIWYHATKNANDITGLGYGDGVKILSGTIANGTGTFVDVTRAAGLPCPSNLPGSPLCGALDQFNTTDNQNGVLSHTGNGSSTMNISVTYQNNDFFKSNLMSLAFGLNDTTNLASPFLQANPSNQVFGQTPNYSYVNGSKVNGADCRQGGVTETGNRTQRCDFHFQSDASTSFNAVAEPDSVALLGLAFGVMGLVARRRKAQKV